MINRKNNKQPLVVLLIIGLLSIILLDNTYGFFDNLTSQKSNTIPIGQWTIDNTASVTNVTNTINQQYSNNPQMQSYLNNVFFTTDAQGNKIIEPIFTNYSIDEVNKTITYIDQYTTNFLTFSNGTPIFKDPTLITPIVFRPAALYPGEYLVLNHVILTANWTNYEALNFSLTIYGENNINISDYAVEVLVDNTPLDPAAPFEYNYQYYQGVNRLIDYKVQSQKNILNPLTTSSQFQTEVRRPPTTLYNHTFGVPTFTGGWCRLPIGANMYLTTPQTFIIAKNAQQTGLILPGAANGSRFEMIMAMRYLKSRTHLAPKIIPVSIVLTRGVSNDGYSLNLSNVPTIEFKVFK